MQNKTEAIASAAANFQMVSNRLASRTTEKKGQANKAEDTISDSLETSDSDSQGAAPRNQDRVEQTNRRSSKPDSSESGSILDISG